MRKVLRIISGLAILAVIVAPLIVAAQAGATAECCRLSQNITMTDMTYGCPVAHAPCAAGDCAFIAGSSAFIKDTVIGGGDCLMATTDTCSLKGVSTPIDIESTEWGTICLLNSLYSVINWIFFFFLAIAILIGVLAGYMFMTAAGDPGKVEKARNLLMYMIIGLIVAAVAKVIPTLVRTVVGF